MRKTLREGIIPQSATAGNERAHLLAQSLNCFPCAMVASLAPAKLSLYVKVANFPGLYRHSRSGRYYGCKKLYGTRRVRSLETCDRKIAERRLKGVN